MRAWDTYECMGVHRLWQGVRRRFSVRNYPTWTVDADLSLASPAISRTSKGDAGRWSMLVKQHEKCLTFLEVSPQNLASSQKKTFDWELSVQWLIVLKCFIYEGPQQHPAFRDRPFWRRAAWEMEVFLVRMVFAAQSFARKYSGLWQDGLFNFHRTDGSKAEAEDRSAFSFSKYFQWQSTVYMWAFTNRAVKDIRKAVCWNSGIEEGVGRVYLLLIIMLCGPATESVVSRQESEGSSENHNDSPALATAACLHREDRGHLLGFIRWGPHFCHKNEQQHFHSVFKTYNHVSQWCTLASSVNEVDFCLRIFPDVV